VSSTARRIVYADRMVDSESPAVLKLYFPRLDVRRPELVELLRADLATDDVLPRHGGAHRLCGRLRCDAANVESIHSAANAPRVTLRSVAGRLARSRSLTAEALARARFGGLLRLVQRPTKRIGTT
jgi:hypothetical protein